LKTCPIRCRHLAWGEDGEKSSALQPVEPDLVGAGVGREESAFMIAEEIRRKELRSHVVVIHVFLRGGISHEEAEDIVAISELQRAIVVFEKDGGYNVVAGVRHGCVKKRDQPKARGVVENMVDFEECESV